MATGNIIIPLSGFSSTAPPEPIYTNGRRHLAFDDTVDEILIYEFKLPANYSSTPAILFNYSMTSATTGNVVFGVEVMAVTGGDAADIGTDSYDTVNSVTSAVPGTAGHSKEQSLSLTNFDSGAAGDYIALRIRRDADNASDTATGDMELWTMAMTYTTT